MNATMAGNYNGMSYSNLGTASINAGGHVSPSPARMREIVGIQLGILDMIRFFAQLNVANGSPMLTSVAAGLRLAI
jgi:hypothetical protein